MLGRVCQLQPVSLLEEEEGSGCGSSADVQAGRQSCQPCAPGSRAAPAPHQGGHGAQRAEMMAADQGPAPGAGNAPGSPGLSEPGVGRLRVLTLHYFVDGQLGPRNQRHASV